MLRLDMGQLGLSFDDETLPFWRKKLFETTLHPTKLVADSRRVFTKVPFGDVVDWYKEISACTSGSASRYDRK